MIWRRKPAQPSRTAVELLESSHTELQEARERVTEAREVGASLAHSQQLNHFGLGLERAIRIKETRTA